MYRKLEVDHRYIWLGAESRYYVMPFIAFVHAGSSWLGGPFTRDLYAIIIGEHKH